MQLRTYGCGLIKMKFVADCGLKKKLAVPSTANFTGPRFKLRTSRSRDERITAQPAKELISVGLSQRPIKSRALLQLLSCVLIS